MEEEQAVRIVAEFCLAIVGSSRRPGGQGKRGAAVCLYVRLPPEAEELLVKVGSGGDGGGGGK